MQLEILELTIVDEFRAIPGADQGSVHNRPGLLRVRLVGLPAGQVLAVK